MPAEKPIKRDSPSPLAAACAELRAEKALCRSRQTTSAAITVQAHPLRVALRSVFKVATMLRTDFRGYKFTVQEIGYA